MPLAPASDSILAVGMLSSRTPSSAFALPSPNGRQTPCKPVAKRSKIGASSQSVPHTPRNTARLALGAEDLLPLLAAAFGMSSSVSKTGTAKRRAKKDIQEDIQKDILTRLQTRARSLGVTQDSLNQAAVADDPKMATISLITTQLQVPAKVLVSSFGTAEQFAPVAPPVAAMPAVPAPQQEAYGTAPGIEQLLEGRSMMRQTAPPVPPVSPAVAPTEPEDLLTLVLDLSDTMPDEASASSGSPIEPTEATMQVEQNVLDTALSRIKAKDKKSSYDKTIMDPMVSRIARGLPVEELKELLEEATDRKADIARRNEENMARRIELELEREQIAEPTGEASMQKAKKKTTEPSSDEKRTSSANKRYASGARPYDEYIVEPMLARIAAGEPVEESLMAEEIKASYDKNILDPMIARIEAEMKTNSYDKYILEPMLARIAAGQTVEESVKQMVAETKSSYDTYILDPMLARIAEAKSTYSYDKCILEPMLARIAEGQPVEEAVKQIAEETKSSYDIYIMDPMPARVAAEKSTFSYDKNILEPMLARIAAGQPVEEAIEEMAEETKSSYDENILLPMLARIAAAKRTFTYDKNILEPMLARIAAGQVVEEAIKQTAEETKSSYDVNLLDIAEPALPSLVLGDAVQKAIEHMTADTKTSYDTYILDPMLARIAEANSTYSYDKYILEPMLARIAAGQTVEEAVEQMEEDTKSSYDKYVLEPTLERIAESKRTFTAQVGEYDNDVLESIYPMYSRTAEEKALVTERDEYMLESMYARIAEEQQYVDEYDQFMLESMEAPVAEEEARLKVMAMTFSYDKYVLEPMLARTAAGQPAVEEASKSSYDEYILDPMLARIAAEKRTFSYDNNILKPMLARIAAGQPVEEAKKQMAEDVQSSYDTYIMDPMLARIASAKRTYSYDKYILQPMLARIAAGQRVEEAIGQAVEETESSYDTNVLNPMLARIAAAKRTLTYDNNILEPMLARIAAGQPVKEETRQLAEEIKSSYDVYILQPMLARIAAKMRTFSYDKIISVGDGYEQWTLLKDGFEQTVKETKASYDKYILEPMLARIAQEEARLEIEEVGKAMADEQVKLKQESETKAPERQDMPQALLDPSWLVSFYVTHGESKPVTKEKSPLSSLTSLEESRESPSTAGFTLDEFHEGFRVSIEESAALLEEVEVVREPVDEGQVVEKPAAEAARQASMPSDAPQLPCEYEEWRRSNEVEVVRARMLKLKAQAAMAKKSLKKEPTSFGKRQPEPDEEVPTVAALDLSGLEKPVEEVATVAALDLSNVENPGALRKAAAAADLIRAKLVAAKQERSQLLTKLEGVRAQLRKTKTEVETKTEVVVADVVEEQMKLREMKTILDAQLKKALTVGDTIEVTEAFETDSEPAVQLRAGEIGTVRRLDKGDGFVSVVFQTRDRYEWIGPEKLCKLQKKVPSVEADPENQMARRLSQLENRGKELASNLTTASVRAAKLNDMLETVRSGRR